MNPEELERLKEREKNRFMKFYFGAKDGRIKKWEAKLAVKELEKEIKFEETKELLKILYEKLDAL
jgi:hypothetical protein